MFREAGAFYQNRQWNAASGLFLQPCTVRGLNIGRLKGFSLGPSAFTSHQNLFIQSFSG